MNVAAIAAIARIILEAGQLIERWTRAAESDPAATEQLEQEQAALESRWTALAPDKEPTPPQEESILVSGESGISSVAPDGTLTPIDTSGPADPMVPTDDDPPAVIE